MKKKYSDETTDAELIALMLDGDARASTLLVERYHGRLIGFLMQRVKNHAAAEDLAQDVWLRVIKSLRRYDKNRSPFVYWLFLNAGSLLRNRVRKAQPEQISDHHDEPDKREAFVKEIERYEAIERVLKKLPPERQEVVRLRLEGYTFEEIGRKIGRSAQTVCDWWHSIRHDLGDLFGPE